MKLVLSVFVSQVTTAPLTNALPFTVRFKVCVPGPLPGKRLTAELGLRLEITGGGPVTVTFAVPLMPLLAAEMVNGPPAVLPAVKSPLALTVPPPLTDQVNVGCDAIVALT